MSITKQVKLCKNKKGPSFKTKYNLIIDREKVLWRKDWKVFWKKWWNIEIKHFNQLEQNLFVTAYLLHNGPASYYI